MKKLILKTIKTTLLIIACIFVITYLAFAIFSPLTLAKGYDSLGCYKVSVHYHELAYKSSDDNLTMLLNECIKSKDSKKIIRYGSIYVENNDKNNDSNLYDYFVSEYIIALYNEKCDNVIEKAVNLTNDYSQGCPLRALMFCAIENGDKDSLTIIYEKITQLGDKASESEKEILQNDLINLSKYLHS